MTEEIKAVEVVETIAVAAEPKREPHKNESNRRGERGNVGPSNIKGLYHSFQRNEGRKAKSVSLKSFAHLIAETGTDEQKVIALDWLKRKAEKGNKADRERRKTTKGPLNRTIALASKNARRS